MNQKQITASRHFTGGKVGRLFFSLLPLISLPSVPDAQADTKYTATLRVLAQEEYNDNVSLDAHSPTEDWITLLQPGILLQAEKEHTRMSIDYSPGLSYYAKNSIDANIRHVATADISHKFSKYFMLRATDTFTRTNEQVIEKDGEIDELKKDVTKYNRNNAAVEGVYTFGANNTVRMTLADRRTNDLSSTNIDSDSQQGILSLDYEFSHKFSTRLSTAYTDTERNSVTYKQYDEGLNLFYRLSPMGKADLGYRFLYADNEDPPGATTTDSRYHQIMLGYEHLLRQNLSVRGAGGYYIHDYLSGKENTGILLSGAISGEYKRTLFSLSADSGSENKYSSFEDVGTRDFIKAIFSVSHQLSEFLRLFGNAYYRTEDYLGLDDLKDRTDDTWRLGGGLSWLVAKNLALECELTHLERSSTERDREFTNNRVLLRVKTDYTKIL